MSTYKGSCLCSAVKYEINCEPGYITNCHCGMCRKQHGAPSATYVTFDKSHLNYIEGEAFLSAYNSSSTIERRFCSQCGSSIEWRGHPEYPHITSISLSTFDTPFKCDEIKQIHEEDRIEWVSS